MCLLILLAIFADLLRKVNNVARRKNQVGWARANLAVKVDQFWTRISKQRANGQKVGIAARTTAFRRIGTCKALSRLCRQA